MIEKGLNIERIIQNMQQNNVLIAINSPVFLEEYTEALKIQEEYPSMLRTTLGSSPSRYHQQKIDKVIENIHENADKIIGIGEVGLDYYWVKEESLQKKQQIIFKRFIALAEELQLPIIIHSREAEQKAYELLKNCETKVMMHSYGGSPELAKKCSENGFYISIPTCVTNRKKHQKIVQAVKIQHLLTETDAPFLSPLTNKKPNEPANIIYGVKKIAEIKEMDTQETAKITYRNACKLFNLQ